MIGGPTSFELWVPKLRTAHDAAQGAARHLADEIDGPLSDASRRAGSGIWTGAAGDHFRDLIRTIQRLHVDPLAEYLARLASTLMRLGDEADLTARAVRSGVAPPAGVDIPGDLARWRSCPLPETILAAGWFRPPGSGHISIDFGGVRELARSLGEAASDFIAIRNRLTDGLAPVEIEAPPVLDDLAVAAEAVSGEVLRRHRALEKADSEAAAGLGRMMAAVGGVLAASARLDAVRPKTKAQWKAAALRNAGVDGPAWDPRKGLAANDVTVVRVWERYGEFNRGHPELQWAGMANLVGPTFYAGWQDLHTLRGVSRSERARLIALLVPGLPKKVVAETARRLTDKELGWFEERFLIMQRKIFEDLAWQHEAYLAGGIAEMRRLKGAGQISDEQLQNWEDIASGDAVRVARGNRALLRREQRKVIGDDYDRMRRHHPPVGEAFTRLLSMTAESPIPGGKPYRDVIQHVDLPDLPNLPSLPGPLPDLPDLPDLPAVPKGNVAKFNDRWKWIDKDMLPAYRRIGPERLDGLIDTPIAERAAPLRRLPALEYHGGS